MQQTPKRHYLDILENMLNYQQGQGDRLSTARIYEVLGHINIENLSTANILLYRWEESPIPKQSRAFYHKESPTASFFRGIRYLIKAARCYGATGNMPEAYNVLERITLFLIGAIKERFFDEEILRAVSYELLGDVFCLQQDTSTARGHYRRAKDLYKAYYSSDESLETAWQGQEEFGALGAIFERLDSEIYSDIWLETYVDRLRIKERCGQQDEAS